MRVVLNKILNILVFISICAVLLLIINIIFSKILKFNKRVHLKFLKSFIDVIVVAIFSYFYLSRFELTKDISKTIMQGGTLMIAIATFAAQRVLSNVISGISISYSNPFDIGDKVKVVSTGGSLVSEGIVIDINLRHTIIKKFDGQCDIIPNSIMDSSIISNTNLIENVGNFIELEVSYDSDIDLACKVIKDVILDNDLTLNTDESTSVFIKDFTSNGVVLRVLVVSETLDDSFKSCSEIRRNILEQFKLNGIVIPYQTVTILN